MNIQFDVLPNSQRTENIQLPRLPAVIRYYDEFNDDQKSFNPADDVWVIHYCGRRHRISFEMFEEEYRSLIRCWAAYLFGTFSPGTALIRHDKLARLDRSLLRTLIQTAPLQIRGEWLKLLANKVLTSLWLDSIKSLLYYMCEFNIRPGTKYDKEILSLLPINAHSSYSRVRSGEAFLDAEEEHRIVSHLDSVAADCGNQSIAYSKLQDAAILICCYQFGMRPIQIATLRMKDARVWNENNQESVHLSFKKAKQRRPNRAFPLTRKVKSDWTPCVRIVVRSFLVDSNNTKGAEGLLDNGLFRRAEGSCPQEAALPKQYIGYQVG